MFWIILLGLAYLTLIIFYREARPLVRVGFNLLLVFIRLFSLVVQGFLALILKALEPFWQTLSLTTWRS